jgi:hypothetical protein
MLQSHVRYGFVLSADEIMFLKLEIVERTEYRTRNGEPVDLWCEPWLLYSDPIKFADAQVGTHGITAKQGLLYLTYQSMKKDWELSESLVEKLNCIVKEDEGVRWIPKPSWLA